MQPEPVVEQAVILCGGLGTRLRPIVSHLPKSMVVIRGRPFLEWLLLLLAQSGIARVALATGYRGDQIRRHFATGRFGMDIAISEEVEPLGTAGALRQAVVHLDSPRVLVLNGDSFCRFDLSRMRQAQTEAGAVVTLWLEAVADANRFGTVEIDQHNRVLAFREKTRGPSRLVNAGVYLLDRAVFELIPGDRPSSLERDIFPGLVGRGVVAVVGDGGFLDIGTPESLESAESILAPELQRLEASVCH